MFRASVARQARLAHNSSTHLRPLLFVGSSTPSVSRQLRQKVAQQLPQLSRPGLFVPQWRLYSSGAAEAARADADAAPKAAGSEGDNADSSSAPIRQFEDLYRLGVHQNIVQAITHGMKYVNMTDVQTMTIAAALQGKDMIAQAKTGTGKTLAFLVPVLQQILATSPKLAEPQEVSSQFDRWRRRSHQGASVDIRAIIISPTRELAEQIGDEAKKLCRRTGLVVQTAVGGTRKDAAMDKMRREGCHILVATPGRLNDLLTQKYPVLPTRNLSALVLDEADRMLDTGFERELQSIIEYLPDRETQPRQTLLFSATIPRNVVNLARRYVDEDNFEFVQTIRPDDVPTHEKVPQFVVPVRRYENMLPAILEFMQEKSAQTSGDPFKAIVFLPSTAMVHVAGQLFEEISKSEGSNIPKTFTIHSGLSQRQRTEAADRFKRSRSAVLISSDVTARGMDFPNVSHVIQYGLPPDRDQYIHRLGRTGRANRSGEGWVFVPTGLLEHARDMLAGLPIRRHEGLQCAELNEPSRDLKEAPPAVRAVCNELQDVDNSMLARAYQSHLGFLKPPSVLQAVVGGLNDWTQYHWGWSSPPAIPASRLRLMGLSKVRGLNIGNDWRGEDDRPLRGDHSRRDKFSSVMTRERNQRGYRDGGFGDRRRSRASF